ncbi:hypothetical protein [Collinsella intestinalis]|uniref:hypothetical protein n=1 Tax=Collinsella intestinalis TaxID=147207 RepID=UPI001EF6B561|nr:hypothetical protein [Collinsella intestinalis]
MSQATASAGRRATRPGTAPRHRLFAPLALSIALAMAFVLGLTGCSDLGAFDEAAVARQAEDYYAAKYGEHVAVTDVWEDRGYSLFSYYSLKRAFCTMTDGSCVLVDFEEGPLGDTRQEAEITAAYEKRFRSAVVEGKRLLQDAGYTVSLVLINGYDLTEKGFFTDCISPYDWDDSEGGGDRSGSFFYTRYTGDERFFEEEAARITIRTPQITFEIAGADAAYANGFPTGVPDVPAWTHPIDAMCRELLPLTAGNPRTEVCVYQEGFYGVATDDNGESGLLGELSPFDRTRDVGDWLIVDWIGLGHGVYLASDEHGVRLHPGDVTLEETAATYTFDDLVEKSNLTNNDVRAYDPAIFETYELVPAEDLFAALPASVQDKGWLSVRIAYDNTDPETGLAGLGVTPGALTPSLYSVEENPAVEDFPDGPELVIGWMRETTLANGYQHRGGTLYRDEPIRLVRL